jgi:hypothetical protein
MFLFNNTVRTHSTAIRGVQYNVFSCYDGKDTIFDRIGNLIEDSFSSTAAVEIAKPLLLDNDIALGDR